MRNFSKWDLEILDHLAHDKSVGPSPVDNFLNHFFFRQEAGRALIIQAQLKYAVFFLKTEIFDSDEHKHMELSKFLDLLSLLKYLQGGGYISIHKNERGKEKAMYFLQDSFINPQPSAGTILLNAAGDYTANPETIHSKDKKVSYKGITFEHDMFDLIQGTMTGTLIKSQHLKTLDVKPAPAPKQPVHVVPILLSLCALAMVAWSALTMQRNERTDNQSMATLLASHQAVQNKLDELARKIPSASNVQAKPVTPVMAAPENNTPRTHYGIDVSKWNGNIEKELDAVDSLSFVICKATHGKRSIDPEFHANWKLLKARNLIRGAYHFYLAYEDPIDQAEFFWTTIQELDSTDITPIVDIEDSSLSAHLKTDALKLQVDLLLFLKHLEKKCGRKPMIYTGLAFANEHLTSETFSDYPLWLADYTGREKPRIPHTWKSKGYKIWQKSDTYTIHSSNTDLDIFFGRKQDLYN